MINPAEVETGKYDLYDVNGLRKIDNCCKFKKIE